MVSKIAIVGNGSFAPSHASEIDGCDLVIRFNDCRSVGDGGSRTDVVAVCNTGRPALAMVRQRSWRERRAVSLATALWCVRDSSKFEELRSLIAAQYPSLGDFCDDYTDEFARFAEENGKAFAVIPRLHHDRLDLELLASMSGSYVVPSSGLLAVSYVIGEVANPDDTVLLAGFDHQGWSGHPFDAERKLIETYISKGHLYRLQP